MYKFPKCTQLNQCVSDNINNSFGMKARTLTVCDYHIHRIPHEY